MSRGPCAVRAVVEGVTKCHCVLGTVKAWHRGVSEPFAGCEVCDAYRCKKDAGVKTTKTGLGHKRQRTTTEEQDVGASAAMAMPLELVEVFGIVGHRLFDSDSFRNQMMSDGNDFPLREELTQANYRIEIQVRGRFRAVGRAADPGKVDTRWVLQSELVSKVSGGIAFELADWYVRTVIDSLGLAYGVAPEQHQPPRPPAAPTAVAPTVATPTAAAPIAAAPAVAAPAVAAPAAAAPTAAHEGFMGAGVMEAAAVTNAAQHDALVTALAAHIETKRCTLSSIYNTFVGNQCASPSEFSIWLRRDSISARRISARKAAQIDEGVAAFLQAAAAAAAAAPAAAPAPLAAAAGPPAVLTRTLVRILV
jgi:hypothetical protein